MSGRGGHLSQGGSSGVGTQIEQSLSSVFNGERIAAIVGRLRVGSEVAFFSQMAKILLKSHPKFAIFPAVDQGIQT